MVASVLTGSGVAATELASGGGGNHRRSGTRVAATDLAGGGGGQQRRAGGGADRAGAGAKLEPGFQFAASTMLLTVRVAGQRWGNRRGQMYAQGLVWTGVDSATGSCVQDMLWASAAHQDTRPNDDREIPKPRWRLAREGQFLVERSPESIRSMGAGCAFRHTTYRASDYEISRHQVFRLGSAIGLRSGGTSRLGCGQGA